MCLLLLYYYIGFSLNCLWNNFNHKNYILFIFHQFQLKRILWSHFQNVLTKWYPLLLPFPPIYYKKIQIFPYYWDLRILSLTGPFLVLVSLGGSEDSSAYGTMNIRSRSFCPIRQLSITCPQCMACIIRNNCFLMCRLHGFNVNMTDCDSPSWVLSEMQEPHT